VSCVRPKSPEGALFDSLTIYRRVMMVINKPGFGKAGWFGDAGFLGAAYNKMMDEQNPVVLLCNGVWHIVEHSRRSNVARCGKPLRDRQAHSRLKTIGREHVCPKCLQLFAATEEHA